MNPSPRHPWKALAVVIAVFALTHGARAHVFSHGYEPVRVHVGHAFDSDCRDIDVHDDDDPEDEGSFDDSFDDWFDHDEA